MTARALIVDWGGVLTTPLFGTLAAWAEQDGLDLEYYRQAMREWLGDPDSEQSGSHPVAALERGEIDVAHFEEQLAARLRTITGEPVPAPGLITRMFDRFEHAPDMVALVARARRAGIKTALLSNSWGNNYPRDGWDELFEAVVISGEVGMRKPEPEIFRYTLGLLNVAPSEAVFVDDLSINVRAAARLGLIGVHHTSYETTATELEAIFGIALR